LTLSPKHLIFLLFLLFIPFIFTLSYGFKSGQLKGVYHRVKKGETLYSIARAYKVHIQDLAEVNHVENPSQVEVDRVLFIPDADEVVEEVLLLMKTEESASERKKPAVEEKSVSRVPSERDAGSVPRPSVGTEDRTPSALPSEKASPPPSESSAMEETPEMPNEEADSAGKKDLPRKEGPPATSPAPAKSSAGSLNKEELQTGVSGKPQFDKKRFIWPVKGRVISRFGIQPNKMYYNWISISAQDMAPVVAAASGTVIFSSELKDYGETIIIKHTDNFTTVYTHLKVRKVRLDDPVKKGEVIALVGRIGKEGKVYLNFEVRHQNRAKNPLFFLP